MGAKWRDGQGEQEAMDCLELTRWSVRRCADTCQRHKDDEGNLVGRYAGGDAPAGTSGPACEPSASERSERRRMDGTRISQRRCVIRKQRELTIQ